MKKNIAIIGFLLISVCAYGQQSTDVHSTPEKLVSSMFSAIKTKDNCVLRDLCDYYPKEADADVMAVCGLFYLPQEAYEMFVAEFGNAYISGYVTYETYEGVSYANVPIKFGKNVDKDETIQCVNRAGKWFLYQY